MRSPGRAAAVAAAYFLTGRLAVHLAIDPGVATAVWPPSGIALAAMLAWGPGMLTGVWLGSFLVNIGTLLPAGARGTACAAAIASGSAAQAFLTARLLRAWAGDADPFARASDVFKFLAVSAAGCLVASTVGSGSLLLAGMIGPADLANNEVTWWLGDLVGILVVAPSLLTWPRRSLAPSASPSFKEMAAILASLALVGALVFGSSRSRVFAHSLAYLMTPILLWAVFRFAWRGFAVAMPAICAAAVWGTLENLGPFANQGSWAESLLQLQAFLGVLAATGLLVCALLAERERAEAGLLSARVELERKVSERTAELTRSNQDLEQFAYVASHDLQEPLRKIQLVCERLRPAFGALDAAARENLRRIESSAGRMRQLISSLLKLSKVSRGDLQRESVDLDAMLKEILADMEERAATDGGSIEVGPLGRLSADAEQMRQLLQNLLSNALKFHPPSEPPRVKVSSRALGSGMVEITVADRGVGFEERFLDRLFKPFQRLHARAEFEGSGIGLSICRRIVSRHGGSIEARSEPGRGSTFIVTLPSAGGGA